MQVVQIGVSADWIIRRHLMLCVCLTLLLFHEIQKSRQGTGGGVIAAFHSPNNFKGIVCYKSGNCFEIVT
jgi:hypothetical protein